MMDLLKPVMWDWTSPSNDVFVDVCSDVRTKFNPETDDALVEACSERAELHPHMMSLWVPAL